MLTSVLVTPSNRLADPALTSGCGFMAFFFCNVYLSVFLRWTLLMEGPFVEILLSLSLWTKVGVGPPDSLLVMDGGL